MTKLNIILHNNDKIEIYKRQGCLEVSYTDI